MTITTNIISISEKPVPPPDRTEHLSGRSGFEWVGQCLMIRK
jgi:hypothetical protein